VTEVIRTSLSKLYTSSLNFRPQRTAHCRFTMVKFSFITALCRGL